MTPDEYTIIQRHRAELLDQIYFEPGNNEPEHYFELKQHLSAFEFKIELKEVAKWKSNEFVAKLKKRLQSRDKRPDLFVSFESMVKTESNEYYWNLVNQVLQPQNFGEMLQIIAPRIKYQLKISYPQVLPRPNMTAQEQRDYFINFDPVLTLVDVEEIDYSLTYEELSHVVMADRFFVDLTDIQFFPIGTHANLKLVLQERYPKLAAKIYNFNTDLRNLDNDIEVYQAHGMTPKQALENLSRRLFLSSSTIHGDANNAGDEALAALHCFQLYYYNLSEQIQNTLSNLTNNKGYSLAFIFSAIEKNQCAKVIGDELHELVKKNKNDAVMHVRPKMLKADLISLINKYKYKNSQPGLNCKFDGNNLIDLPSNLTIWYLKHYDFKDINKLAIWISNFNELFFTMLLPCLSLNAQFIIMLLELSKDELFTAQQKNLLALELVKDARANDYIYGLFDTLDKFKYTDMMIAVLGHVSSDEAYKVFSKDPKIILNAADNVTLMEQISDKLDSDDLVGILIENEHSLLPLLGKNSSSFTTLTKNLSDEQWLTIFKIQRDKDVSLLEKHLRSPAYFEGLYNCIPKKFRFYALKSISTELLLNYRLYPLITQFVLLQFPIQWRSISKIKAIFTESTRLYRLALGMTLFANSEHCGFPSILIKIHDFYARSVYQSFTEQYITKTESQLRDLIEAEYKSYKQALKYCGRFFSKLVNTETDNNVSSKELEKYGCIL